MQTETFKTTDELVDKYFNEYIGDDKKYNTIRENSKRWPFLKVTYENGTLISIGCSRKGNEKIFFTCLRTDVISKCIEKANAKFGENSTTKLDDETIQFELGKTMSTIQEIKSFFADFYCAFGKN